MLRSLRSLGAGLAFLLLILSIACDSTGPGSTSLSILLTDAPGDVKAAVVTISEVYLQGGGDDDDELEDADELDDADELEDADELDDDDDGGRVTVSQESRTIDLLTLATSTTPLVSAADVPAGQYKQLRFIITGGYVEVENTDGSTSIFASSPDYAGLPAGAVVAGQLKMPSFASSGLKIKLPRQALNFDGVETVLLVDFDVAESFGHETGSGAWVMHPVISGVEVNSEAAAQAVAARP